MNYIGLPLNKLFSRMYSVHNLGIALFFCERAEEKGASHSIKTNNFFTANEVLLPAKL
jgi:hypothetical protein